MIIVNGLPVAANVRIPLVAITSASGATSWDWYSAPNAIYNVVENSTLSNPVNAPAGAMAYLYIVQNATTAKTLAFGNAYQPSNNLPLLTTALSSVCYTEWYSDGSHIICTKFIQTAVI